MKKAEKVLLLLLVALLICRMAGVPLTGMLFALCCFALALTYAIWGSSLLRIDPRTPSWMAIVPGFALAAGLVALPFLTYVRREVLFDWLTVPNTILFLVLIGIRAVRKLRWSVPAVDRLLFWRSTVLFAVLAFLAFMPPNAAFRAVIIALNTGHDKLVANMHMVEEFRAFEAAFERGDCAAALTHAERSNRFGQVWLFGPDGYQMDMSGSVSVPIGPGERFDIRALTIALAAQQRKAQLWKISRTYENLYDAHRCLGEQAEAEGDVELAYRHYFVGDSLFNAYDPEEGHTRPGRVWSLVDVARTASLTGEVDLSDSLFRAAVDLYKTLHDSLDIEAAPILHAWATANADHRSWRRANYLERMAIAYASDDTISAVSRDRWLAYRLKLAKNFIASDSLTLADRVLERMCTLPSDSARACEFHLVHGSLRYWECKYREAREDFIACSECFDALGAPPRSMAVVHSALGYAETALASYAEARKQVSSGQQLLRGTDEGSRAGIALLQLSAAIHHQQGHYTEARKEFEQCNALAGDHANDHPGALTGLAEVLTDLAELQQARGMADRALVLVLDSLTPLVPSYCNVMNTSAEVAYHLGNLDEARHKYTTVLEVLVDYSATERAEHMHALNGLGLVALAEVKLPQADSLLSEARRLTELIFGTGHPFTAQVLVNQAQLRIQQRRLGDARSLLLAAQPITQRTLGTDHDLLGDIAAALGEVALHNGDHASALVHHTEALRIYRACFPADHPKVRAMESRVH